MLGLATQTNPVPKTTLMRLPRKWIFPHSLWSSHWPSALSDSCCFSVPLAGYLRPAPLLRAALEGQQSLLLFAHIDKYPQIFCGQAYNPLIFPVFILQQYVLLRHEWRRTKGNMGIHGTGDKFRMIFASAREVQHFFQRIEGENRLGESNGSLQWWGLARLACCRKASVTAQPRKHRKVAVNALV